MAQVKFNSKEISGFIPHGKLNQSITIQRFLLLYDEFLEDKKLEGLADRTLTDYKRHLKFLKKYIDNIEKPEEEKQNMLIDNEFFKGYVYYMTMEKEYQPATINIRLTTLKCYCNWLFYKGYTSKNYSLILKKVKVPEDMIKPLSNSDVKKMLAQPKKDTYAGLRDFTIMIVILDCGVRINELCNVEISDVDLKEKLIHLRAEICKTRKSRDLPLSKQSVFLLKQLIDISIENNSSYVFMNTNDCIAVKENAVIRNFEYYGKRAGLNVRCTPHVFRHTFATNAVKSGIDLFTLQKILGHQCLQTTRKYVQLNTEDLVKKHDQVDFVSRYFGGAK